MNDKIPQGQNTLIVNDINIQDEIYNIRGLQVMLDRDLAELYGVETKHINQAVKNNNDKFLSDFFFELDNDEFNILRSNDLTAKFSKTRTNPKVFTEQGIYMLATILKSKIASDITVSIIRTFANMRKLINSNDFYTHQLKELEKRQLNYEIKSDEKFDNIFNALEDKQLKPANGIFYDGQIFDAYTFISNILRTAKKSIILIDNYVDDITLTLFSKIPNIQVSIYTHTISKQLKLDLEKYNKQYKNITLKTFKNSHDRFLILDDKEVYLIGASLKDLGQKWFGFSKLDISSIDAMLKKLP
jgi:hypothetical protein